MLCKDQKWEVATADEIVTNRVCIRPSMYTVYAATNSLYNVNAGGLSISRDGGQTFTNYTNGLPASASRKSYGLMDTYVDANGTIYTANQDFGDGASGGISVSRNGGISFGNYNLSNGLGSNFVNTVFSTITGVIYAGTMNGLSISKNGTSPFTNRTTADGLGSNDVKAVVSWGGNIYAGTSGGLSISEDGGMKFFNRTTTQGLGSNRVLSVFISHLGSVFVGTSNGLSISTDGGKFFVSYLSGIRITDIFVSRSNTIYAATDGDGLLISRNGGKTFDKYSSSANGLGNDHLLSVFVEGSTIFAATHKGLSISYDGGAHFVTRTEADGLGHRYVTSVYVVRH